MQKPLSGRTALVTGAGSGMGKAHAVTLASAGASVILFDLDTPESRQNVSETIAGIEAENGRAIGAFGSVQSLSDLEQAAQKSVDEYERSVDILVANAGIGVPGDRWDVTEEDWARLIDVNLSGVWRSCRAVIPGMIKQGGGRLILISSCVITRLSREEPAPAYTASKAGIVGLAKALAVELGDFGVSCNCIAPGNVATNLNAGEDHSVWTQRQALKVQIDPEDVSSAVLFLASDASRMISGVVIPVDGGFAV